MPHVLLAIVALVIALAAPPAAAAPCAGFTDVEDTSPFCPNVTWLRNRSITLGCAATLYCPNDFVTRLQMAAFMNRLGNALFPLTCAAGQVMKWDGINWGCANDNLGGSGGGGTVTSVAAGTGLQASPNPITGAGAINLAASYQLPQACSNGQVPKSNGAGGWTCAADNDTNSGGTVTSLAAGTGITLTPSPITTSGTIAVNTTTIQQRVTGNCAVGSYIRAIAADGTVTCQTDNAGPANAFVHNGNAFAGTAVFGTTDNNALDIRVNNSRVMRYEPNAISPNVIGGSPANNVTAGVRGATIAGGGVNTSDPNFGSGIPNRVTDAYGTVAGGYGNRAGDDSGTSIDGAMATVGGGYINTASAYASTVGGGQGNNASGLLSMVGGGVGSIASGLGSTVGGGELNTASGQWSTVGGGVGSIASGLGSTVGGGANNAASGPRSTVGGGLFNTASGAFSWAGGHRARTQTAAGVPHDGAFAWADSNDFDFYSSAPNEFAVRATGGVRFVTQIDGSGNPTRTTRINANGELEFGNVTRQMLNLWGSDYGIGVQADTQYFRSVNHYAWYHGGTHSNLMLDPGPLGARLMTLTNGASSEVVTGTLRAQVITATSDRGQKRDFAAVDAQDVLARVVELPIETWVYRNEPAVRHMGPTGQAFQAAFGLGHDDKSIATVDADGVALAAIQGLNAKLEAKIAEQARDLAAQQAQIVELQRLVAQLLARP